MTDACSMVERCAAHQKEDGPAPVYILLPNAVVIAGSTEYLAVSDQGIDGVREDIVVP